MRMSADDVEEVFLKRLTFLRDMERYWLSAVRRQGSAWAVLHEDTPNQFIQRHRIGLETSPLDTRLRCHE